MQGLREAGVPGDVRALLPGRGEAGGAALTGHDDIIGVAFTGSTEVARAINRGLAGRDGPIATLIAETGGAGGEVSGAKPAIHSAHGGSSPTVSKSGASASGAAHAATGRPAGSAAATAPSRSAWPRSSRACELSAI